MPDARVEVFKSRSGHIALYKLQTKKFYLLVKLFGFTIQYEYNSRVLDCQGYRQLEYAAARGNMNGELDRSVSALSAGKCN